MFPGYAIDGDKWSGNNQLPLFDHDKWSHAHYEQGLDDFIVDVRNGPVIQKIHFYQRPIHWAFRNENLRVFINGETVQCAAEENYSISALNHTCSTFSENDVG